VVRLHRTTAGTAPACRRGTQHLGRLAGAGQVQRIDEHTHGRVRNRVDDCAGLSERAHPQGGQELENQGDGRPVGPRRQRRQARGHRTVVGLAAGHQHMMGTQLDGCVDDGLAVVVGRAEHDRLDVERDQPVVVEPSSDRSQHLRRPGGRVEPHPHRREARCSSSVDGFGRPDVGHGAGRQRQQA
jgi:hypothetical protein